MMTNYEKIKQMPKEELIKIIRCPYGGPGVSANEIPCWHLPKETYAEDYCNKCRLKWLDEESK